MNSFCLITTTCPDEQNAKSIIHLLLEQKLAACIQMQAVQSFYHWEGKLCESCEQLLLIKTRSSLFQKIEALILKHHPYTTPQIIQLPIEQGLKAYLQWIEEETT
ncbi:divalent-cation tolerance protein CutA [Sulfurospirillum diekertiae]|uniref:Divalent-cation tolerance protein CutA n=1 Tax=Sulfurospirillum diekertiae TaxID=1854492 RepID=A0A6G9VPU3_9BACT|nr:divalent-cation tolerance protein CutA [Sulfurospirillum diekertiae]QIR75536.1 divalent-cation tolerance protein CutA [Sulfurospirillum diekertiae]QIR78185.1 divalent-cation tolerance protein CutA [Sulfurospirillum diekertiae]